MSAQSPRVDAHLHLWRLARGDYGWITLDLRPLNRDFEPEDARPLLEAAGIDQAVLVQAAPTVAETRFLLEIARDTAWVAGVVGWIDMAAADAPAVLDELAADPALKAIRPMIQDIPDPDWMLQPVLRPAFAAIQAHGLAFDALIKPQHLRPLLALLEREPELRVVIDHGAKPAIAAGGCEPWASDMARLARETHAYCKLSGLVTEAGPDWTVDTLRRYVDHLLATFGPDRLIWGSDWPVVTLASDYAGWRRATRTLLDQLDATEAEVILGTSAIRFYRLDHSEP